MVTKHGRRMAGGANTAWQGWQEQQQSLPWPGRPHPPHSACAPQAQTPALHSPSQHAPDQLDVVLAGKVEAKFKAAACSARCAC